MSRDLKSYYLGPHGFNEHDMCGAYNGWMKRYIVDIKNTQYGAVLVRMKQVTVGYKLTISFDWEFLKYKVRPKFERFRNAFIWLWFYVTFEKITSDKPDKIIQDHIAESEGEK